MLAFFRIDQVIGMPIISDTIWSFLNPGSWIHQLTSMSLLVFCLQLLHEPLTRYVKLRVAHAPGMPGTFSPAPQVSDPDMHHGTCVTHVPWWMPGSLTSGFLWMRWRGKRPRHSRRMRNPQFYVSGKRPIVRMYSYTLTWHEGSMDHVSWIHWLSSNILSSAWWMAKQADVWLINAWV